MALEYHGAIKARAGDFLVVDDHSAGAWQVEPGQDVKHRGFAATRMSDDAGELAAPHRKPQVFEHGGFAAVPRREPARYAFDRDEVVG